MSRCKHGNGPLCPSCVNEAAVDLADLYKKAGHSGGKCRHGIQDWSICQACLDDVIVAKHKAQTCALDEQVGGSHYKDMVIQPIEFIHKNAIGFCEGSAITYLCRWRAKNGIQDLKKAIHFIEMLIDMEAKKK